MPVVQVQELTKSYGSRRGVHEVGFSLCEGEVFGFLGPNGAGKSTTIRVLLGFLRASSGVAQIFGKDCWYDSAEIKRDVGYVAGDVRLYPWLTGRRAFDIVSDIRRLRLHDEGYRLAERFQLEVDLPVRKMSRGNRQKLALVLALAHKPKLVLLDEPTSGLDPLMQDVLASCLRDMAQEGRTVFFSSHTLSEVESLCDPVAIVRDGRIVADETVDSLRKRAPRRIVLKFDTVEAATACSIPESVLSCQRDGKVVELQCMGSAVPIMRWAIREQISDVSIGSPNLESLFREYYGMGRPEEISATDPLHEPSQMECGL